MRHSGLDILSQTVFYASDITIAHQYDMITIDAKNAMHHIAIAINPCQYNIPHRE